MPIYARSDLMSVAVPAESGGCGNSHSRPVIKGAPVKVWKLDCPPCEQHLRGDRKPKILKHNIKDGRVVSQERVPDADPHWSSTPDTVPLTPDQEKTHHVRIERGEQQLRALESIAHLSKAGIDFRSREDVLFFLRENQLPEDILQGTVVCVNGHDAQAGVKFCPECGASMSARAAIGGGGGGEDPDPIETGPVVDLGRLHVATLRKRCRDAGLPDKGSKDVLIGRLQQAA